jgi:hypothetical protein
MQSRGYVLAEVHRRIRRDVSPTSHFFTVRQLRNSLPRILARVESRADCRISNPLFHGCHSRTNSDSCFYRGCCYRMICRLLYLLQADSRKGLCPVKSLRDFEDRSPTMKAGRIGSRDTGFFPYPAHPLTPSRKPGDPVRPAALFLTISMYFPPSPSSSSKSRGRPHQTRLRNMS